jgi:hypothetical protein
MKKLLSIIVVIFLLSGNSFEKVSAEESCYDFIKESVQYNTSNTVLQFDFKNTSRKTIKIYSWGLLRKDGSTLKKSPNPIYLQSNDSTITQLRVTDLNLNMAGNYEYYCKFEKKPKIKKKKYKSNKPKGGFEWWYLLFIPAVVGVIGGISDKASLGTHLGIKKGSKAGGAYGIIIMLAFIVVCIILILKTNNF